jgi:hypothetical protein
MADLRSRTGDVPNVTNEGVTFGADPFKARLDVYKSVCD